MTTIAVDKWQAHTITKLRKELPEMNNEKINREVRARLRVQKYRATHRRIDYAPSPTVLAAIERHLAAGLDNCFAGVLDRLIEAGDKAISGNAQR